jgi:hypothetical protein
MSSHVECPDSVPPDVEESRLRIVICIRRAGKAWKLAWFREDKQGIYGGYFGNGKDWHFSYHADGTMHFKENKGDLILNDAQTTEIAAVKEMKVLSSSGFPIHSMGRITDAFKGNARAIHVFLVEQGDFSSYTHLGITYTLIHTSFEDQFIRNLWRYLIILIIRLSSDF